MGESVSFKAYLKRDGQEVEVRRFAIEDGAASNFMYLRSKVQAMFPSLQNDQFQIFWQDNDKDYIKIDTDEELVEALTGSGQHPLKLYVQILSPNMPAGSSGPSGQQMHLGVVCDSCGGSVVGFRYKCVTCPDYDLCSKCESAGQHLEHFMLRLPTPIINGFPPKLLRKLISRPHKFHKRHGWSRLSEGVCGDAQGSRCPFARRGEATAAAMAGVTDMFDFSALMEFINALGVATGEEKEATAGVRTSATSAEATSASSSQATASGSQNQTSQPQANAQQQNTSSRAPPIYPPINLTSVGQAIAAFLDPLGIDVTFDVRTKQPTPQPQQPTSASATAQPTPGPSPPAPEVPSAPSASSQTEATPATATETQTEPPRERRNSDGGWTLLNRESPARAEAVAMDVEETQGANSKTPPPEIPQAAPAPSAPLQQQPEIERRKIQEAIDTFRAMGFNFDPTIIRDLLQKENGDILSVLEMILNNTGKK